MKWYTAIGKRGYLFDGEFHILADGEDKVLQRTETYLWTALLWGFCEEGQVLMRTRYLLGLAYPGADTKELLPEDEAGRMLKRLCMRGALFEQEAQGKEEAVERCLKKAELAPVQMRFFERVHIFLESLAQGNPVRVSFRAFQRPRLTETEKKVLKRLRKGEKELPPGSIKELAALFEKKLLTIEAVREV